MRIGVVSEGLTDTHAITYFLKASLEARGVQGEIIALQPPTDRTRPAGGWGLVLNWLENNPPRRRLGMYLSGGPFEDEVFEGRCDAIVLQLDSDNLSKEAFRNGIRNRLGREVVNDQDPVERGHAICDLLSSAAMLDELTEVDRRRHICVAAVESTETWCIGCFRRWEGDIELLRDEDLGRRFMEVLHMSEGRPVPETRNVDKSSKRREEFCRKHAQNYRNAEEQCYHYRQMVERAVAACL